MFTTVFPPIIDALLAGIGLIIVSFWTGVFLFAGVVRLRDRLVPSASDRAAQANPAGSSVPIGVLEEEVTT